MDLLSNEATGFASAVLPSLGFAEKRGSMINGKGRLQRLNRAVRGPGRAGDDWEILRDLIQAVSGGNGIFTIEDVFRQMSDAVPEFAGLTLSRISDLGVQILNTDKSPNPPATQRRKRGARAKRKKPAMSASMPLAKAPGSARDPRAVSGDSPEIIGRIPPMDRDRESSTRRTAVRRIAERARESRALPSQLALAR